MSIAGKRSGLDGSRSSLFYEAIRIVKEMREKTNGEKPIWICWENVPYVCYVLSGIVSGAGLLE